MDPSTEDQAGADHEQQEAIETGGQVEQGESSVEDAGTPSEDSKHRSLDELFAEHVDEQAKEEPAPDESTEDTPDEQPAAPVEPDTDDEAQEPAPVEDAAPAPDDDLVLEPQTDPRDERKKYLGKVPDEEWGKYTPAARERVKALRAETKDLRQEIGQLQESQGFADYGKAIVEFTQKHQIPDEGLQGWLELGAKVNQGGQAAVDALINTAKSLGYQEPTPTPAPQQTPDWLRQQIEDGSITEDAAKLVLQNMPAPTPTPQPAQQATAPQRGNAADMAAQQMRATIEQKHAEGKQRFGVQWDKVREKAERILRSYQGQVTAESLPAMYDMAVEAVVAKYTRKPQPQPSQAALAPSQAAPPARENPDAGAKGIRGLYARHGIE